MCGHDDEVGVAGGRVRRDLLGGSPFEDGAADPCPGCRSMTALGSLQSLQIIGASRAKLGIEPAVDWRRATDARWRRDRLENRDELERGTSSRGDRASRIDRLLSKRGTIQWHKDPVHWHLPGDSRLFL
jgi:hypothetical protein